MSKVDENARSFSGLLQSIGDGAFHAETSEAMHDLTKKLFDHAIDFTKAKGTLTLTLAVEVDRDGLVKIVPDVKTKTPKPARKNGVFWLDPKGDLSPENPKQQKLPLREVSIPAVRHAPPAAEQPPRSV